MTPTVFWAITAFLALMIAFIIWRSFRIIGPAEVGLMMKRFGPKLPSDNPIAFKGEAGYQAELLMPGVRFKWWFLYKVEKFPWVQVSANEIGVLIAQVGKTLPAGAKSARYKKEFGNFTDLNPFIRWLFLSSPRTKCLGSQFLPISRGARWRMTD